MRFLSLFSGIGGFDLGLERAGMTCVGQVEIDPFCRAVLAKHWPDVKRMNDVREVKGDEFGPIDCIAGGVPCQPASTAGKRKGADDARWMWPEFVRLVRFVGPRWFVAENPRGLLSLGDFRPIREQLEGAGYTLRPLLLGAHHVGAPHKRDRIWLVGHLADSRPRGLGTKRLSQARRSNADKRGEILADASGTGLEGQRHRGSGAGTQLAMPPSGGAYRWPSRPGEPQHEWEAPRLVYAGRARREMAGDPEHRGEQTGVWETTMSERGCDTPRESFGQPEPGLGITTGRTSRRLVSLARRSSLRALGNIAVPQVAEVVGRAIMAADRGQA